MKKPTKLQKSDMQDARLALQEAILELVTANEYLANCGYEGTSEMASELQDVLNELNRLNIQLLNYIHFEKE